MYSPLPFRLERHFFLRILKMSMVRYVIRWVMMVLAVFIGTVALAAEPVKLAMIEGLSGNFANAGEAVHRNLLLAVERINARGGVRLPGGARPLELLRFDSKGSSEETLAMLKSALDQNVSFVRLGSTAE